jgi:hypothetical protein
MNVKEPIDHLKDLPGDMKVLVRGYEDGFNDIKELKRIHISLKLNTSWYYGEYALYNTTDAFEAIGLFGDKK